MRSFLVRSMMSARARLRPATRATLALGAALLAACDDPLRPETADDPVVDRVELSAPFEAIFQGDTLRVTAAVLGAAGDPLPSAPLVWTSSDTAVATVANGLVSARRPGRATILASSGDAQGALGIVVAADVYAVYAAPGGVEALPGKVVPLKVVNRFGNEVRVPAVYASSDTTVATVSERGWVTAKAPGTALVTIRYLTRRLEVPVRVHAVGYRVTYLGDLGGGESQALGLNERGQVVGRAVTVEGAWRGFLWEDGRMQAIGYPGMPYAEAVAVNEHGVVVGNAGSGSCEACLSSPWSWEDGKLTPIQVGPNAPSPRATDVNDLGQVSGYTFSQGIRSASGEPFIWHDGVTRWPGPAGGFVHRSQADAINNEGAAVGRSMSHSLGTWGMGWSSTGGFRAAPSINSSSYATDINDRGQVVGYIYPGTEDRVGVYVWSPEGVSFLGAPDAARSEPAAINNLGDIVGGSETPGSIPYVSRDGYFVDLNLLVDEPEWTITGATDINDRGQIVGYGRHRQTGLTGALLLTPPE